MVWDDKGKSIERNLAESKVLKYLIGYVLEAGQEGKNWREMGREGSGDDEYEPVR